MVQQPVERALMLLAAASPPALPEALAQLSIGQRDARLLQLREWAFGPQLIGLASCGNCGERLELTFNSADIRLLPSSQEESAETAVPLSVSVDGYEVSFRLPDSLDLASISGETDGVTFRGLLLERCILSASHENAVIPAADLPGAVVTAVAERMSEADPQADIRLALTCASCGHHWQAPFDILSFFWSEINAWAYRILREVHALALAYGWREADILAMTPWRRQFYLAMIGE